MRERLIGVILFGDPLVVVRGGFSFTEVPPFAMTQGFVSSGPGSQSPFMVMPNGMVQPMNAIPLPVMGAVPGPFFQSNYPSTGFHVGQVQTTMLRGSSSQNPEPVLPKRLPSLDSYVSGEAKTPNVIVNPTNLEVIHHHSLVIPVQPKVEPVIVQAAPPSVELTVNNKKSDAKAVVEEHVVARSQPVVENVKQMSATPRTDAVIRAPDQVDDSDDLVSSLTRAASVFESRISASASTSPVVIEDSTTSN